MEPEQIVTPAFCREMQLMKEDTLILMGQKMTYRLYAERNPIGRYWIESAAGNECVCVYAGQDLSRAAEIYQAAVRGEVTPCTLQYVVEDYFG